MMVKAIPVPLVSLALFLVLQVLAVEGKKCPSACTRDILGCRSGGGKIIGYCVNGLACCDYTYKEVATCGETKGGIQAINFLSPEYPKLHSADLICPFGFVLMEDTVAIKIEFINITMDGLGFAGNGAGCDSDMFVLKGFKTWTPPPLCGNLTGYATIVERTIGDHRMSQLKIVALMSSLNYNWKIKLSQIRQPKRIKQPIKNDPMTQTSAGANIPPNTNSAQEKMSNQPGLQRQSKSRNKINHFSSQQMIENSNKYGESLNQGSQALNPDAESIFIETGDIFEDNVDELEMPMIVNGDDTKIDKVPYQVSIRLIYSGESNDTDDEDVLETTSTESSNDIFGATIDYDSVTEADGNGTNHTTPAPQGEKARNCSNEEGYHFCGGTIISDRFILTASHCFYGNSKLQGMEPLHKIKIVLGDSDTCTRDVNDTRAENRTDISPSDLTQQEYDIETVIFHYGYDNIALLNDVALIKLTKPIEYNSHVKRVRLAKPGEDFQGKEAVGSGWGKRNLTASGAQLPHVLQSSPHFLIRNQTECNLESERLFGANQTNVMHHPKYMHAFDSVICTSTKAEVRTKLKGNVLVGPGDSGGPLVAQTDEGEKVLIGIVSYGIPSEHSEDKGEFVDYFQSVAFFYDWIHLAMMV